MSTMDDAVAATDVPWRRRQVANRLAVDLAAAHASADVRVEPGIEQPLRTLLTRPAELVGDILDVADAGLGTGTAPGVPPGNPHHPTGYPTGQVSADEPASQPAPKHPCGGYLPPGGKRFQPVCLPSPGLSLGLPSGHLRPA